MKLPLYYSSMSNKFSSNFIIDKTDCLYVFFCEECIFKDLILRINARKGSK